MSNAPRVTLQELEAAIKGETYTVLPDGKTTICQLTLDNNFTVEGFSACVSIENFDTELGKKYSRERAISKLWEFMGFRLADKLMLNEGTNYQSRMKNEFVELSDRCEKLKEFMDSNALFETLPEEEQHDMWDQYEHMDLYRKVLAKRIQRFIQHTAPHSQEMKQ